MSKLKGKTIMLLEGNSAVPFVASTIAGAGEAAKVAGINTTTFDGMGQPPELTGFEQGVARGVAGIFMCAVRRGGQERLGAGEEGEHPRG